MITLRLFRQGDPPTEIEARTLAQGALCIGRDETADWILPDTSRTLSRRHCLVTLSDGVLTVRDDSTNGLFFRGQRLPAATPTTIPIGATFTLGAFLIRVEPAVAASASTAAPAAPVIDDSPAGRLLDAFCQGAQIESSFLSAEDPAEVMRRMGAIYREMVLGLARLVDERARGKAEVGLDYTSIQALDNNPFRWAPPQRLAVDLLQPPQGGFMESDAAVRASFADVSDHQQRLAAGSKAAVEDVLAGLSPERIEDQVPSGFMKKRAEALWAEFERRHGEIASDVSGVVRGPAFREAYHQDPDAAPRS